MSNTEISLNEPKSFALYESDFNEYPEHLHKEFELITVTEGAVKITVAAKTYTLFKNNSILIFPNQVHSLIPVSESRSLTLMFSSVLVNTFAKKYNTFLPLDNTFALHPPLKRTA